MARLVRIFALSLLLVTTLNSFSRAEDMTNTMDNFYDGLATVIQDNMSDPGRCAEEVDKYYKRNQKIIEKVHKMIEESGKRKEGMAGKYESMTDEEIEAFENKSEMPAGIQPPAMPGSVRYTKALQAFILRYPQQGMKIASKAMEFVPDSVRKNADDFYQD